MEAAAPMRVVLTHTDFRIYWPARIAALERLLRSHGHSLKVIELAGKGSPYAFANRPPGDPQLDWLTLFPERTMESLKGHEASHALWRRLDRENPDIVVAGSIVFPAGATAVGWCKANHRPVVIFDDVRLVDVPRPWFVDFIKRCLYRNVDAVVSPAPSQAESFEFWGVGKPRIFFGLNVVDNDWFAVRSARYRSDRQGLLQKLQLPEKFLLGVGRFVEKKNWFNLVRAFSAIQRDLPPDRWVLVLVGEGPERIRIKKFCVDKRIKSVILRPFVSQEELCGYYAAASGVVLPSSYGETWGLVINEAMASGLPVLVSDQCGCADSLVVDGRNGFAFSPDDEAALGNALCRFLCLSEEERIAMGQESAKIISSWPPERFGEAVHRAMKYAGRNPVHKPTFWESIIIKCWKGRYRPR